MRAIIINPVDRSIAEIDHKGDYDAMRQTLQNLNGFFTGICRVGLTRIDDLWVDDEGLLREGLPIFRIKGYPNPCAGGGLILGHDAKGDSAGTTIHLDAVKYVVEWTEEETTGRIGPTRQVAPGHIKLGDGILQPRGTFKPKDAGQ
jgi:hypothetical protein